jgi:polyferredoxin
VAANYAALWPVVLEVPYLLAGALLLVASIAGSLVCGWSCPFGFLQDLLGKITQRKTRLPSWLGHGRYVVLIGLVILSPLLFGLAGVPYEKQAVSICRLCPAGALEAGLPYSIFSLLEGGEWTMSAPKIAILSAFLISAVLIHRPWCRMLCPLGGFFALFNRISLFHLHFKAANCTQCNLCRSRCPVGVAVDKRINVATCIRCLECTTCGAIEPALARPQEKTKGVNP